MDKSLVNLTVHQARDMLDRREVSSVELTQATLERIEEVDDRVKAFVTVTRDLALEQAREADRRIAEGNAAPLTGIPMQLKDNMCTNGVSTTCSSRMTDTTSTEWAVGSTPSVSTWLSMSMLSRMWDIWSRMRSISSSVMPTRASKAM